MRFYMVCQPPFDKIGADAIPGFDTEMQIKPVANTVTSPGTGIVKATNVGMLLKIGA